MRSQRNKQPVIAQQLAMALIVAITGTATGAAAESSPDPGGEAAPSATQAADNTSAESMPDEEVVPDCEAESGLQSYGDRWVLRSGFGLGFGGVTGVYYGSLDHEGNRTYVPVFGANFIIGREINRHWSAHAAVFGNFSFGRDLDLQFEDGEDLDSVNVGQFNFGAGFTWSHRVSPLFVGFTAGAGRRALSEFLDLDLFGDEDEDLAAVHWGLGTEVEVGGLWRVAPSFRAGVSLMGHYFMRPGDGDLRQAYSFIFAYTMEVR